MAKQNISIDKIRILVAKDLRDFGRKLVSQGVISQDYIFQNAASECEDNTHGIAVNGIAKKEIWGYNLNRVILKPDKGKLRHVQPSFASDISIEYSVNIAGALKNFEQLSDPLCQLNFNVILSAKSENDQNVILRSCWHLDRNIQGGNLPLEAHPCYHFQFGGHNMQFTSTGNYQYGTALFLDSPRLAHKPLDAILATDFLLSNFMPDQWNLLRSDNEYQNLIKRSYNRLWQPYAHATSHHWGAIPANQLAWKAHDIWPQLHAK